MLDLQTLLLGLSPKRLSLPRFTNEKQQDLSLNSFVMYYSRSEDRSLSCVLPSSSEALAFACKLRRVIRSLGLWKMPRRNWGCYTRRMVRYIRSPSSSVESFEQV